MSKPSLFSPTDAEVKTIRMACDALIVMPRSGPIRAMSLCVDRDGRETLTAHLESGSDVGVRRESGETWDDAVKRFNDLPDATEET